MTVSGRNESVGKWGRVDFWINNAGQNCPYEFIYDTKTPDGKKSPVIEEPRFKKIFNILADKPETVEAFFVPRIPVALLI